MRRFNPSDRKLTVQLMLNQSLVTRARNLTDDLSGTVEMLLKEYVDRSGDGRTGSAENTSAAIEAWNAQGERYGSIADEYSPLQ